MWYLTLDISAEDAQKLIDSLQQGKLSKLGVFSAKLPDKDAVETEVPDDPDLLRIIMDMAAADERAGKRTGGS